MTLIKPGSTIGIFGSGQLGRMFAIEAAKLGYRVHAFSPDKNSPTGQISALETAASYHDLDAVRAFAKAVDVITFEFENVPFETVEAAAYFVPVHPKGEILHTTQNRLREKTFLKENAVPHTPFRHITDLDGLKTGVAELGLPCVLKTAGFGYDGKGQYKIKTEDDILPAFESLGGKDAVLEAFVDFEKEVSVVCARALDGEFVHYAVIENEHTNHILDVSFAPGHVSAQTRERAIDVTRTIAEKFDYVGTMCVEFFVKHDGDLLVNEIAPRPHNSGHLTFDACVTSQFEQQVRAICGLPLGSTDLFRPAAMLNILGDAWKNGEPNWAESLAIPNVKLHLYGKAEPRPGRKMGHFTSSAESVSEAVSKLMDCRNIIDK